MNPSKIDIEQTKKMVVHSLKEVLHILIQHGCIVDLIAKMQAKEALVSRYPRDAYTLATKLHSGFIKQKKIVIVFLMNNVQKQVLIILITIYYMISIPIVLKFIMN